MALVVAVGSDDVPPRSVESTPTTAPTPTAYVPPTVERLLETASGPAWELLGLTNLRDIPIALEGESQKLPGAEIAELWHEFFGGARLADNGSGKQLFELCSDGTGQYLEYWTEGISLFAGGLDGKTFTWEMTQDRGGRWNAGKLVIIPDDPTMNLEGAVMNFSFERRGGEWTTAREGAENVILDSPDCD